MKTDTVVRGMVAGLAGVAAMTLAEKLEQALTGRPSSYVPAHTLSRLAGRPLPDDARPVGLNWAMHWGQGVLMGAARAAMAEQGVRGPMASLIFLNLRLLNDQTLENATGVGELPWRWPVDEQAVDLLHKAVYAFVTGAVADALVDGPRPGWTREQGWTGPVGDADEPMGAPTRSARGRFARVYER